MGHAGTDVGNGRLIVEPPSSWPSDLEPLLKDLASAAPSATILSRESYRDLAREAATGEFARSRLSMDSAELEQALKLFEARFPGEGKRVARAAALWLYVGDRVAEFETTADKFERAKVMHRAYRELGMSADPWPYERLALASFFNEAEHFYVSFEGRICASDPELALVTPDRTWRDYIHQTSNAVGGGVPEDVVSVMIDVGVPAVAGAIASRVLDSVVRFAKRRMSADTEGREATVVRIYAPNGTVLKEVRVIADDALNAAAAPDEPSD